MTSPWGWVGHFASAFVGLRTPTDLRACGRVAGSAPAVKAAWALGPAGSW
jgi:hypothetical protein